MDDTISTENTKNDALADITNTIADVTIPPTDKSMKDEDVVMEEPESKTMSDDSGDTDEATAQPDATSPMETDDAKDEEETIVPKSEERPSEDVAMEDATEQQEEDEEEYDGPTIDLGALMNVEDLSADQKKIMEERLGSLQEDYKESVKNQRELRLIEIKNGFKFNVDMEITDEEASFIHDFCKKHQFDVMEKIEDEGFFFLKSIREMLDERKRQRALQGSRGNSAADKKRRKERRRRKKMAAKRQARAAAAEAEGDDEAAAAIMDESGSEWEASGVDDSDDSDYIGSDFDMTDLGADLIDSEPEDTDEVDWVEDAQERKKRRAARRRAANPKSGHRLDGEKRCGRLLLDDAMKDLDSKAGWSEARIKAYEQRETNPNSYYYRFNDPNEKQAGGLWSKKEQKLFMERLKELGANVRWGVFSMTIPGRVGYQCSNYYRQLVQTKAVTDPNYHFSGGKLNFRRGGLVLKGQKYSRQQSDAYKQFAFIVNSDDTGVWTNLPTRHPKCPKFVFKLSEDDEKETAEDAEESSESGTGSKKKTRKGKKRRAREDEEAEPVRKKRRTEGKGKKGKKGKKSTEEKNDPNFTSSATATPVDVTNPLPELIDMITNEAVVQPAISPYGHVLGYQTWTRILRATGKGKNTCPFTKQKLTRRQLRKLTHENIDQYKDKIVNLTEEELGNVSLQ